MDKPKYVDIANIESEAIRLHRQLNNLCDDNRSLYGRSIERLMRIEKLLSESSQMIHALCGDEEGLSYISHSDSSNRSKCSAARYVMSNYRRSFAKLEGCSLGVTQATICANLIVAWFNARFNQPSESFKYSYSMMNDWIDGFIIEFGKSILDGTYINMYNEVQMWMADIKINDQGWAVPPSIKQAYSAVDPNYYTLQSVVLEKLIKPKIYENNFLLADRYSICNKVSSMRPDLCDQISMLDDPNKFIEISTQLKFQFSDEFRLEDYFDEIQ